MLFKSLIAISILAASVIASGDVITPAPKGLDVSKIAVPGNSKKFPVKKTLEEMFPGEIYKWDYPPADKLEQWYTQPEGSKRDECSLDIKITVGSCKSGAYGYKPQIIPYNEPSTKAIEGKVKFVVDHEHNNYTDYTQITVDCYWRGRLMVTDTPEVQQRIGLIGVRVDTSPFGMQAWVTADPDKETGYKQSQIAPVGFFEFGGHKPYNKAWSTARGYKESVKKSSQLHESLYVQVC